MIQNDNLGLGHAGSEPSMWRRYIAGWIIVALISLLDASWLYLSGHAVMWAGIFAACKGAGTLICLAVILRALTGVRRYHVVTTRLRYAKVTDIAAWCALLLCFVSSTCVTSYLCVSINAPLIDSGLVAFDRSLGFDWLAAYEWMQRHPHVQKSFKWRTPAVTGSLLRYLSFSACSEDAKQSLSSSFSWCSGAPISC